VYSIYIYIYIYREREREIDATHVLEDLKRPLRPENEMSWLVKILSVE